LPEVAEVVHQQEHLPVGVVLEDIELPLEHQVVERLLKPH
jgi:hypothetical protein